MPWSHMLSTDLGPRKLLKCLLAPQFLFYFEAINKNKKYVFDIVFLRGFLLII
jgi:hypothetical protein